MTPSPPTRRIDGWYVCTGPTLGRPCAYVIIGHVMDDKGERRNVSPNGIMDVIDVSYDLTMVIVTGELAAQVTLRLGEPFNDEMPALLPEVRNGVRAAMI